MRKTDSSQTGSQVAGFPVSGTPENGDVPTYNSGNIEWSPPGALTRTTASVTSSSLADDAADSSKTIAIGKSGVAFKVATDAEAWVVGYVNAAARTADSARTIDVEPTEGSGVLFDTVHETGALTVRSHQPRTITTTSLR